MTAHKEVPRDGGNEENARLLERTAARIEQYAAALAEIAARAPAPDLCAQDAGLIGQLRIMLHWERDGGNEENARLLERTAARIEQYAAALAEIAARAPAPDLCAQDAELKYALDRMCTPLDDSRLSGATAQEDARCVKIIAAALAAKDAENAELRAYISGFQKGAEERAAAYEARCAELERDIAAAQARHMELSAQLDAAPAPYLCARLPVIAWQHLCLVPSDCDTGPFAVIHDKTKKLWLNVDPKHVEHYTIPLVDGREAAAALAAMAQDRDSWMIEVQREVDAAHRQRIAVEAERDKLREVLRRLAISYVTANPGVLHHYKCDLCGGRWSGRPSAPEQHSETCDAARGKP